MAEQVPSLYESVLADRQQRYNKAIVSGSYEPFIYPWDAMPGLVLFLALLFCPRLPSPYNRAASLTMSGLIAYLCISTIRRSRTLDLGCGYGTGLVCTWGMIMTVTLLLVNDPRRNFQRIEQRQCSDEMITDSNNKTEASTDSATTRTALSSATSIPTNRKASRIFQPHKDPSTHNIAASYCLVWQGYPNSIGHCADWVLDLMTSFRGPNWNWRIPSMPSIDKAVPEKTSMLPGKENTISTSTLRFLQRRAVIDFTLHYFLLDTLKTTMITDPYFLGLAPLSSPTPWSWCSRLTATIPIATRVVRLLMSLVGVLSALSFIFSLSPLFFTLILPTVTNVTTVTRSPLLEPWMYPAYNSSPVRILDGGLPAFWGAFWHQLFRFGVSQPSLYLTAKLHLHPKSISAKLLQVMTAFILSGTVHACASYTTFPPNPSNTPSRPLDPFLFFVLQGVGVMTQSTFTRFFSANVSDIRRWPRWLRRVLNGLTVVVWLYATGPLLADDFARCGIWVFEPVPLSLLRGLGFGDAGGFWCWGVRPGERWLGLWHDERGGKRWWRQGIAVY